MRPHTMECWPQHFIPSLDHYRCWHRWHRYHVLKIFGGRSLISPPHTLRTFYLNIIQIIHALYSLYPGYWRQDIVILSPHILHASIWTQISCIQMSGDKTSIVLSPHILPAHICILITCFLDIGDKTSSSCLPISSMHPFEHKSSASRCPETKHYCLVSPHSLCTHLHPISIPSHIPVAMFSYPSTTIQFHHFA